MVWLQNDLLFRTRDMGESTAFMGQLWDRNQKEIIEGDYNVVWNHRELGETSLSYIAHDCTIDYEGKDQKVDYLRVFVPLRGASRHVVKGHSFVSNPTNVAIHVPGVDVAFRFDRFEMLLLNLSGPAFRKSLLQRFGARIGKEEFVGALPHSPGAATLRSAVTWVASEASRAGSLLNGQTKATRYADRMLQSILMDCIQQVHDERAPAQGSEIQVRQAEAWIDAHLSDPIGVEEVAEAVGISVRSLEKTFKQTRGCSPYQAILQMRFERVREALIKADETATVTQLALEHGFFELGRFSVRYRQRFGESPSQTLKRRLFGAK